MQFGKCSNWCPPVLKSPNVDPAFVATATTLFVVLELTQKLSTEPKMQQLDELLGT